MVTSPIVMLVVGAFAIARLMSVKRFDIGLIVAAFL
jgi:hypothetical protein